MIAIRKIEAKDFFIKPTTNKNRDPTDKVCFNINCACVRAANITENICENKSMSNYATQTTMQNVKKSIYYPICRRYFREGYK